MIYKMKIKHNNSNNNNNRLSNNIQKKKAIQKNIYSKCSDVLVGYAINVITLITKHETDVIVVPQIKIHDLL